MSSLIRTDLDWDKVKLELSLLVKKLDNEIGQGPASKKLIDDMTAETFLFLVAETHPFAPLLFQSYMIQGDKTVSRGFYDPQGLVREITVDPTVTAATGEPPVEYAGVEFSRGGSHDTFAKASLHFEEWFDGGFKLFEAVLSKSLGF